MNVVILMGNLGADPERSEGRQEGSAACRFRVATRRDGAKPDVQGKYPTDWHQCVAFNRGKHLMADNIYEHFKKGMKICLQGSYQDDNYTDKNGVERRNKQVIVDRFDFVDPKSSSPAEPKTTTLDDLEAAAKARSAPQAPALKVEDDPDDAPF